MLSLSTCYEPSTALDAGDVVNKAAFHGAVISYLESQMFT